MGFCLIGRQTSSHVPVSFKALSSRFSASSQSARFGLRRASALDFGILISTISETQQTAMMISLMGLMLPVILLSGFIFPITSMPLPLQIISNIIPAKWFIIIVKGIMLKGVGLSFIWKETLILAGMTLFFIVLSTKKYKIRLE